jgi:DNA-binding NarL/FixJ family response regulator
MLILMISDNPLFTEAIQASLPHAPEIELAAQRPAGALESIRKRHPKVILVDQDTPIGLLEGILKEAGDQTPIRLVMLNSTDNEVTLLDVHHARIVQPEDFTRIIWNEAARRPGVGA